MAVTVVQSVGGPERGSDGQTVVLPSPVTPGNSLVAAITMYSQDGGANTMDGTVSDNASPPNTYVDLTAADNVLTDSRLVWAQRSRWYFVASATGGTYSIFSAITTATNSNSCWNWLSVWEITPAVFDHAVLAQGGPGTATTPGTAETISPGSLTPSAAGALLFSLGQVNSGQSSFTDNEGGWVFVQNGSAGGGSDWAASKGQSTIATDTPSFAFFQAGNADLWTANVFSMIPLLAGVAITASATAVANAQATVTIPRPLTPAAQAVASATATVTAPAKLSATATAVASATAVVTTATVPMLVPRATVISAAAATLRVPQGLQANATALSHAVAIVSYPGQILAAYVRPHLQTSVSMTMTLVLRESSAYDLQIKASAERDETVSTV